MDSGLKLWGILGASALVVSNDSPTLVKAAARLAKVVFGSRLQICDGTNDHVEIQAAIDALPATGGEVRLLDGTYNLGVALDMDSYQTLRGCGRNTILTAATGIELIGIYGGAGTEKIGILIADLCMDGQAQSAGYGVYFSYTDKSKISNCWVNDFSTAGLYLNQSDYNIVEGCHVSGSWEGIHLFNSTSSTISVNYVETSNDAGIFFDAGATHNIASGNVSTLNAVGIESSAEYNAITGNIAVANTWIGIYLYAAIYNTCTGNTCEGSGTQGIEVYQGSYNSIVGNHVSNTAGEGIDLDVADYCAVVGNTVVGSDTHGIRLDNADNNLVACNNVTESSQATDNTDDGIFLMISDDNLISNNLIRMGALANQPRYGINISTATCNRNRVFDNDLHNSGKTAAFNDAATDTELPSITVPFSDGSDPLDSGYLIDANTEYARAFAFLNKEVVQVVRMKVYARAVLLEADKMRAEFVVYGGADNEPYNTHNGSVADHPSTSSNFAADDVIYWTLTEAGILALLGGDSVEVKVLHEAAGNGDIDTQAYFRTVTIEYV